MLLGRNLTEFRRLVYIFKVLRLLNALQLPDSLDTQLLHSTTMVISFFLHLVGHETLKVESQLFTLVRLPLTIPSTGEFVLDNLT